MAAESWWSYFRRNGNIAICLSEGCTFSVDRSKKQSSNSLRTHVRTKHPDLYAKREAGMKEKLRKKELVAKSQPPLPFVGNRNDEPSTSKPLGGASTSEPLPKQTSSILDSVTQCNKDGFKRLEMDKRILEIICTDATPLSIVERPGFARLMKFAAQKYELKSRRFYTEKITVVFVKVCAGIKEDLKSVNYLSFTTDAFSNDTHDLLSLTVHFLASEFEPAFLVIGALPIKGRHTAANFAEMLNVPLLDFEIKEEKIHLFLRDSAASMRKTTALIDVNSSNCFLHVIQLAVKDGLEILGTFTNVLEKVKQVVRKVRTSGILKQHLKDLQKSLNLPQHVLTKGVVVRWNWTYLMLVRTINRPHNQCHENPETSPNPTNTFCVSLARPLWDWNFR